MVNRIKEEDQVWLNCPENYYPVHVKQVRDWDDVEPSDFLNYYYVPVKHLECDILGNKSWKRNVGFDNSLEFVQNYHAKPSSWSELSPKDSLKAELNFFPYFSPWKDLEERLNKWESSGVAKSDKDLKILLRCSYDTAWSNYGEFFNMFRVSICWLNNFPYVSAHLYSVDDGEFNVSKWFENGTWQEGIRLVNRVKAYISNLNRPFDWLEFVEFAKSEGMETW